MANVKVDSSPEFNKRSAFSPFASISNVPLLSGDSPLPLATPLPLPRPLPLPLLPPTKRPRFIKPANGLVFEHEVLVNTPSAHVQRRQQRQANLRRERSNSYNHKPKHNGQSRGDDYSDCERERNGHAAIDTFHTPESNLSVVPETDFSVNVDNAHIAENLAAVQTQLEFNRRMDDETVTSKLSDWIVKFKEWVDDQGEGFFEGICEELGEPLARTRMLAALLFKNGVFDV